MYLYIEAEIDGRKFSITSQVMGSSKTSKNVTYTLYPTIVFLENDEIVCDSVQEDFEEKRTLCFLNKSTDGSSDYCSNVPVLEIRKVTLS